MPKPKPNSPEAEHRPESDIIHADDRIAKILAKHVTHLPTGLVIDDSLSFEDWLDGYKFYSALRDKTQWLLGDFLRHGEKYGERYAQAVDLTGKKYNTLANIVYVCGAFTDRERRHEDLPFSWHEAVASLLPQQADAILAEARRKRAQWDRDDVRDAAAKAKGLPTRAQRQAEKENKAASAVRLLPPAGNPPTLDGHVTVETTGPHKAEFLANQKAQEDAQRATGIPETPAPAQPAPEPEPAVPQPKPEPSPAAPASVQDQAVAIERTEAALNRFLEESKQVDWKAMGPIAKKRWLTMLVPVDKLIDALAAQTGEQRT